MISRAILLSSQQCDCQRGAALYAITPSNIDHRARQPPPAGNVSPARPESTVVAERRTHFPWHFFLFPHRMTRLSFCFPLSCFFDTSLPFPTGFDRILRHTAHILPLFIFSTEESKSRLFFSFFCYSTATAIPVLLPDRGTTAPWSSCQNLSTGAPAMPHQRGMASLIRQDSRVTRTAHLRHFAERSAPPP